VKIQTWDGRVFEGTARQIVEGMRELSFYPAASLREYLHTVVARMASESGASLDIDGLSDDAACEQVVDRLIKDNQLERL
jgi:hypothetical protein